MRRHAIALALAALFVGSAACLVDIPPVASDADGSAFDASAIDARTVDGPIDAVFEQTQTSGCSGARSCIPAAPPGWSGPSILAEGAPGTLPACPATLTQTLSAHENLSAPDATCAACTCSLVAPTCKSTTCSLYLDGSCFSQLESSAITSACAAVTVNNARSAKISTPVSATANSCVSGGGNATLPAATWGSDVLACANAALTPVDCPSGELCADTPPSPFESRACISSLGDVACPASGYTQKRVVYTSILDKRGCSTCGCTVPTGVACTGTAQLAVFSDKVCATQIDTYAVTGACSNGGAGSDSIGSMRLTGASLPNNFDCATSGGQPTGAATPASPTTVCCLP